MRVFSGTHRTIRFSVFAMVSLAVLISFQNCGQFDSPSGNNSASIADGAFSTKCTDDLHLKSVQPQRLNRAEYDNAVRDIFGINQSFTATFSEDPVGITGYNTDADSQTISIEMTHDYWNASKAVVDAVFAMQPVPILACDTPGQCAAIYIRNLTRKAFRRPATQEEIDIYTALFNKDASAGFIQNAKTVAQAVLMSPQFIFRTFEVPETNMGSVVRLAPYEYASRISFFLWGSIPDEELLSMAENGSIYDSVALNSKVRQMLSHPNAKYLSRKFTSQWLNLSALESATRSTEVFPTWSDQVKTAMTEETLLFLENIFAGNNNVSDIIGADFTYVNNVLANHYEMSGSFNNQFTKVQLDNNRRGILTHGSFLSVTASEVFSSPIKRGLFVVSRVLCTEPPPPPPNIPALPPAENNDDLTAESAIRQRLEVHRNSGPACLNCHKEMDPVGLAFENFTAAGTYRTKYNDGKVVDASGELPSGERLRDAADLAGIIKGDPRFPACLAANMTTFALATDMHKSFDNCQLREIAVNSLNPESSLSDMVVKLIQSDEFQYKKVNYIK